MNSEVSVKHTLAVKYVNVKIQKVQQNRGCRGIYFAKKNIFCIVIEHLLLNSISSTFVSRCQVT